MLDEAAAQALARHWEDGWNRGDVATIMEPMARDVRFSSSFVTRITGDPAKHAIEGYDALREYVESSLGRSRGVHYTLDEMFVSPESVILLYSFRLPDGTERQGADLMRVDEEGKIIDWRSHYPFRPEDIEHLLDR
jgi:hypothetical protein